MADDDTPVPPQFANYPEAAQLWKYYENQRFFAGLNLQLGPTENREQYMRAYEEAEAQMKEIERSYSFATPNPLPKSHAAPEVARGGMFGGIGEMLKPVELSMSRGRAPWLK